MATSKNKPSELIVLVDADADTRKMYTAFLRHHGFRVMPVMTGREALVVAARANAIVTETHLPGDLDGPGTLRALREAHPEAHCTVYFMTGGAGPYTEEDLIGMGAERVFGKPLRREERVHSGHER